MELLCRLPGRLGVGGVLPAGRKRDGELAHVLEDEPAHRPGIRGPRGNPWTGNVPLRYDPSRLSEAALLALLTGFLAEIGRHEADHHHAHDHEECGRRH
jgi:hypothetical protein